ncbi:MAG TPA: hypothetical protein PLV32_01600 [Chitinophagaceae bacterium]|nr:hypothetical protein [Chitinophagaceae bacterium]
MKPKLYILFFLLFSTVLFSCKNAQKLYNSGDYDQAVQVAAKKLQKKPNDTKTMYVIQDAYRYAVDDHESKIRNLSSSSNELRAEKIYSEYLQLQSLYETIRRTPAVFDIVRPTDYSSFVTTYRDEASNVRVERGLGLMEGNDKASFREAYYEFQKALALKPGDLSIKQKMDDAYAYAVTNVVILPLTRVGLQYGSYNFDYQNFNYDLVRYLGNNNRSNFTRYYAESQPGYRDIRADNFVEMRFSDVNIGRYSDSRETREVSKEVVTKEIVVAKDSVRKEYSTVKAKVTITTRVIRANAVLQATARDQSNRRLWSDTYRGDYNWVYSFATYTGDERALSEEDKMLLNQKEQWPPSNDEIIRIIMDDIRRQTECGISEYYNRIQW